MFIGFYCYFFSAKTKFSNYIIKKELFNEI